MRMCDIQQFRHWLLAHCCRDVTALHSLAIASSQINFVDLIAIQLIAKKNRLVT